MKTILITLLTFLTLNCYSQKFISFPEDDIDTQYSIWVDAFGKAPSGEPGRQKGFSFTAIMEWGFIEPSISNFQALQDGYTDITVSLGINFHLLEFDPIRYYGGIRGGLEFRREHGEILGLIAGFDWRLTRGIEGTQLYIGAKLWVDHRTALEDSRYGDSTGYDGGIIFTNSQARENAAFVIGLRF